jgi:hypothetical protein
MKRLICFIFNLFLFIVLLAAPCFATTITVGSGKDYSTIQAAVNAASCGDIIDIYDATTYNENVTSTQSCSSGNTLTIQEAAGETVTVQRFTINHDYHTITGFAILGTAGAAVTIGSGVDYLTISGCAFNHAVTNTPTINYQNYTDSTYHLITGNTFGPSETYKFNAIHLKGSNHTISNNTFNYINGFDPIWFVGAHDILITGNIFKSSQNSPYHGQHPDHIQSDGNDFGAAYNITIEKNKFIDSEGQSIRGGEQDSHGTDSQDGWVIRNNIFSNIGEVALQTTGNDWEIYNNTFHCSYTNGSGSHPLGMCCNSLAGNGFKVYNNLFVNNSTEGNSTFGGWYGVRYYTVTFEEGTTEPAAWTALYGRTSGKSSRYVYSTISSGAWATDDAAGTMYLQYWSPVGDFTNGEIVDDIISGDGNKIAKITSTPTMVHDIDYNCVTGMPDLYTAKGTSVEGFIEVHGVNGGDPKLTHVNKSWSFVSRNGADSSYLGTSTTFEVQADQIDNFTVNDYIEQCPYVSGCDGVVRQVTIVDTDNKVITFTPAIADYVEPFCLTKYIYIATGTHEPVIGESIHGNTSGATGVVYAFMQNVDNSGTWGAGNIAGRLYITDITGTWVAGETVHDPSDNAIGALSASYGVLDPTGGIANNAKCMINIKNWGSSTNFTADYSLQSGGVAQDVGATIASFSTDFVGTSRPQGAVWDIGAYEYTAGATYPSATIGSGASMSIGSGAVMTLQ